LAGVLLALVQTTSFAAEADLTRYLARYERDEGRPNTWTGSFFGTAGPATLVVTAHDGSNARISINGAQVFGPGKSRQGGEHSRDGGDDRVAVPINLRADTNSIRVVLSGKPEGSLGVRVKQHVAVDLHIVTRIHFQVNASDFDASKNFYNNFGFRAWIPFPSTNTLEVAQAVGMDHPYTLHVEVGLMIPSPDGGLFGYPAIDLIKWTDEWRPEPPYAQLNHLGMARVALRTTHLDADMAYLQSKGVQFLTLPAATGTRFAIFSDPDGVFYELVEAAGPPPAFPNTTSISGVAHVNVNVCDFKRSREFYRMLGMTGSVGPAYIATPEVAGLLGVAKPLSIEGERIQLPSDGSVIELVEWKSPRNPERAYPPPINHIGINRMAYFTLDLAGDVARLKAQGVKFLSEVAPCCEGPNSTSGIVAFSDPDGTFIELLGAITPPAP